MSLGDSLGDVRTKCGEPTEKVVRSRRRVRHELWRYDFGPTRFVQLLNFKGGVLVRIEEGEYGKKG